jgi:quercetin dioxygenase-like cupin family protein
MNHFTGEVSVEIIVHSAPGQPWAVNLVHFTPGARNHWHAHPRGQVLHIVTGTGIMQERGEPPRQLVPGSVVTTAPGTFHWHGASPGEGLVHVAAWQAAPDGNAAPEWGSPVTSAEYLVAVEMT